MRIVQEKGQEISPENLNEEVHAWASWRSANVKKGTPAGNDVFFNSLPPGSDGVDQEVTDRRIQPLVTSGTSDFSRDTNAESMATGYTRLPMSPTDNSADEPFYRETEVDGKTAYCERGNVLDRN